MARLGLGSDGSGAIKSRAELAVAEPRQHYPWAALTFYADQWKSLLLCPTPLGLPPVAVTATAVDSTATPRQRAVEQRPIAWVREVLTGRYGQRHGRNGLLTGPPVENSLFEPFYAQK
ncbi:hypothetical protein C8J57DRAFT_1224341 [Mycena rebaudengoi]|nr:hypothetical protein C8J57DRAFT_1224341 [Mycena rebaudengoi]